MIMQKTNRLLEQASELASLEEFAEAFAIYDKILKKEPKNIKDMTTVLNKIKHKKMYWALQRCLEAVPERRYLIYI